MEILGKKKEILVMAGNSHFIIHGNHPVHWRVNRTLFLHLPTFLMNQNKGALLSILLLLIIYYFTEEHFVLALIFTISILSLSIPVVQTGLNKLWSIINDVLEMISNTILLAVLFFVVIAPISLLKKGKAQNKTQEFNNSIEELENMG